MEKKVYDYIAKHPYSTANQCADALRINGLEAMKCINILRHEGYLNSTVLPLGNAYICDNSNFYTVCKAYVEKEMISKRALENRRGETNEMPTLRNRNAFVDG